jgi:citrate lyase subunit beta / citryl-CoA lyase
LNYWDIKGNALDWLEHVMEVISRSYLFVPGNRPDRFDKAWRSGAHAVVIDLEDAVGFEDKRLARDAVAAWLEAARPVIVRINGVATEWFLEDIALCRLPGVAAVMLPKTESVDDVRMVMERVVDARPILPLIESARGFDKAAGIAKIPGVERLVFGSLDFQIDLGIDGDEDEMLYFQSHLTLISRLAGIQPPVDGVWTDFSDHEGLRGRTIRARQRGFGGKLCIHPIQVGIVNECFRPTASEIVWATHILESARDSNGSAISVDGRMVDRPVILKAEEILRESRRSSLPQP